MSIAFDEFGRPYIIIRDQGAKKRIKGVDALKVGAIFIIFEWIIYLYLKSFKHKY
jgi:hypothetical protein